MENLETALELQSQGYSLQKIADEIGISKTGVHRLLKAHKESLEEDSEEEEKDEERSEIPKNSVPMRSKGDLGTKTRKLEHSKSSFAGTLEHSNDDSDDDLEQGIADFEGYDEDGTIVKKIERRYEEEEPTEDVEEQMAISSLGKLKDKEASIKERIDESLTKLLKTSCFRVGDLSNELKALNKSKNLLEDFICQVTTITDTEDESYATSHFIKKLLKLMKKAKMRMETWSIDELKQDDTFYFGMVTYEDGSEEVGVDFWKYQRHLRNDTEHFLLSSLDIV